MAQGLYYPPMPYDPFARKSLDQLIAEEQAQQAMMGPGQVPQEQGGSGAGAGALIGAAIAADQSGLLAAGTPGIDALTAASVDAFNAPALESINAAYNAPAMEASLASELGGAGTAAAAEAVPSGWALEGIGSAGNYIAPIAGAIGAYDLFANKRHGGRGALQGAASGAAMGSYFGPVGTGIGALIGGGVGYFGDMGDKDRFKEEYGRAQALRDSGLNWGWNMNEPSKGRSIDELIAEAQATGGNVEFARTRDEGLLKPEDTAGYAMWGEKYGKDYADAPLEKKLAVNKLALDKKALSEAKGQIDANKNFDSELDKLIKETLGAKK